MKTRQVLEDLIADYHDVVFDCVRLKDPEDPFISKKAWRAWRKRTQDLLKTYSKILEIKQN